MGWFKNLFKNKEIKKYNILKLCDGTYIQTQPSINEDIGECYLLNEDGTISSLSDGTYTIEDGREMYIGGNQYVIYEDINVKLQQDRDKKLTELLK